MSPSRFHKERALKAAGIDLPSFPTPPQADVAPEVKRELDRAFLDACDAWDDEIDRLYAQIDTARPVFQPSAEVQAFVADCKARGLAAALEVLNTGVPHRYTALYRLDHLVLKNIELIDKAKEAKSEMLSAVPLTDSFCQFVLRDGAFLTSDSSKERVLDGHKYQGVMMAYHGVPVVDAQGELFGSLCHFDVEKRPLSDTQYAHLSGVATALGQVLGTYILSMDEKVKAIAAAGLAVPARPTAADDSRSATDASYQQRLDAWVAQVDALHRSIQS